MVTVLSSANNSFAFSKVSLATPNGIQGGAYFSKIRVNNAPILIQTPKCTTKNGIHRTEKKIYCDLMLSQDDSVFVDWIKDLETRVKNIVFEKKDVWFHSEMDYDSIDYHWQHGVRTYKSDSHLVRCHIQRQKTIRGRELVQIYDEDEASLTIDDIKTDSQIVAILEVAGLKFTTHSFALDLRLRQIMLVKKSSLFDQCLIDTSHGRIQQTTVCNSKSPAVAAEEDTVAMPIADDGTHQKQSPPLVPEEDSQYKAVDTTGISLEIAPPTKKVALLPPLKERSIATRTTESSPQLDMASSPSATNLKMAPDDKSSQGVTEADKRMEPSSLEKKVISTVNLDSPKGGASMALKKPKEVYRAIYYAARRKAKEARRKAIAAYLEAQRIKATYLIDDLEGSDFDDESDLDEYEAIS